jgi:zinc protease
MRRCFWGLAVVAAWLCASSSALAQSPARAAPERYRLDNGLDVILEERHDSPRVAVLLRYNVGARDQVEGYTGLAHMTEHLMFSWSRHAPRSMDFLASIGAVESNGVTTLDATEYFEVVHPSMLERTLAFESDRMGFLLDHIGAVELERERRVVLRERVERSAAWVVPELGRAMLPQLFGPSHAYRSMIESAADIQAISLDNVRWFHQRWYVPSNATLVVVGDFDRALARRWTQRYFGGLARVARPTRESAPWELRTSERRLLAFAPVLYDHVVMVYPTPPLYARDDAELDLIASALTGHDGARITAALGERRLSSAVSARQSSMQLASYFAIRAVANSQVTADQIRVACDEQIERLRTAPIDQRELDELRAVWLLEMRRSNETVLGRAMNLGDYSAWSDAADSFERDVQRYVAVTPASLRRAAARWLRRERRVVGRVRRGASSGVLDDSTQPGGAL